MITGKKTEGEDEEEGEEEEEKRKCIRFEVFSVWLCSYSRHSDMLFSLHLTPSMLTILAHFVLKSDENMRCHIHPCYFIFVFEN